MDGKRRNEDSQKAGVNLTCEERVGAVHQRKCHSRRRCDRVKPAELGRSIVFDRAASRFAGDSRGQPSWLMSQVVRGDHRSDCGTMSSRWPGA